LIETNASRFPLLFNTKLLLEASPGILDRSPLLIRQAYTVATTERSKVE
jgi:hypothetical protein